MNQVFALIDSKEREYLIDITGLKASCKDKPVHRVPMPPYAMGVEEDRLAELRNDPTTLQTAIIVILVDGEAYVVDGNHRIMIAKEHGLVEVLAYVLPEEEWKPWVLRAPKEVVVRMAQMGESTALTRA